jgi:uncharacterized protein (TIGR01244 family)
MSIPNAIEYEGHLVGGQPSASQYKQISVEGYKTVISLRPPDEPGAGDSKAQAEEAGLTFVNIPVPGAVGFTKENAEALGEALKGEGPFVVHCKSGGRVAALFTLKVGMCDGKSVDQAIEEGHKMGLGGLEQTIRNILR